MFLGMENLTQRRRTSVRSICILSVAAIALLFGGCRFIEQLIPSADYAIITEEILTRPTEGGERFFERWITVDYFGDEVLLSADPDGSGDIWVDDALLIEVMRPDGTRDQRTIDFSFGCQGWISSLPPQALTSLFMVGRNRVHIMAYDICGAMIGSSRLCLFMKQGKILEVSPLTTEWRWPTDNPYIEQGYGVRNPYAENKYHTGVDLWNSTANCARGDIGGCSNVYAAGAGIIVAVCPNGAPCPGYSTNADNHNMQGVVIIEHVLPEGRILYSLYAHLGAINPELRVGQFVNMGSYLGTTGVFLRDGRWVYHVHFEIKDAPVLHNPKGGNACSYDGELGPCWGYTPGNPDDYGYHDPEEFIGRINPPMNSCKVNPSNNHLYCLTPNGLDWLKAEQYAREKGGHLVAINDEFEQEWLVQVFGGNKLYWIGLSDAETEGQWQWSNGDPLSYTNWYPGEPNNRWSCGEDYAVMNWKRPGCWNDLGPCSPEWDEVGQGIIEIVQGQD